MKGSKNKSEIGAFMGKQVELKRITIKSCLDRWRNLNSLIIKEIKEKIKEIFKEKIILTLGPLWWLSSEEPTCFQSLGWEDPLEKEMATHSSILAWEIPWTEEPGGLQSMGLQKSLTWLSNNSHVTSCELPDHRKKTNYKV